MSSSTFIPNFEKSVKALGCKCIKYRLRDRNAKFWNLKIGP